MMAVDTLGCSCEQRVYCRCLRRHLTQSKNSYSRDGCSTTNDSAKTVRTSDWLLWRLLARAQAGCRCHVCCCACMRLLWPLWVVARARGHCCCCRVCLLRCTPQQPVQHTPNRTTQNRHQLRSQHTKCGGCMSEQHHASALLVARAEHTYNRPLPAAA